MKFLNKWYIIIWALLIGGLFLSGIFYATECWDGITYDEAQLQASCGVTIAEYEEKRATDPDFCPQAVDAMQMIGGCDRVFMWMFALPTIVAVSIVYNILYGLVYVILIRRQK